MSRVHKIKTKLAGVTATNPDGTDRQVVIRNFCRDGRPLQAVPEPSNPHDPSAVGVWVQASRKLVQVGYIGAHLCEEVADHMRKGGPVNVRILDVTGGTGDKPSFGVNVELELLPRPEPRAVAYVEPDRGTPIEFGWKFRDLPELAVRKAVDVYRSLPEWAQPVTWSVGIACVVVVGIMVWRLLT